MFMDVKAGDIHLTLEFLFIPTCIPLNFKTLTILFLKTFLYLRPNIQIYHLISCFIYLQPEDHSE